jgi:hypothetical protein
MRIGFILALSACALTASCNDHTPNRADDRTSGIPRVQNCVPVDYSQGILYFPCDEAEFGRSVSTWLQSNPDQEVTSMAGTTNDYTEGYFVTVRRRPPHE